MDFYTRKEAATILGVSPYTISNYIKKGILKNCGKSKSILVPSHEIHTFYENNNLYAGKVTKTDILRVESKITSLSSEVAILKMAIGIGSLGVQRTDEHLQVLYLEVMKMLSLSSWSTKEIFYIADLMISIRDSEIARWLNLKGTRAWTNLFDLSERMVNFIKGMPNMPREASAMLVGRMEAGRNRLYGLVFVSLSESIGLERYWAKKLAGSRTFEPTTDEFIVAYLKNR